MGLTQRNEAKIGGFAILIMTIAAIIATNITIGSLRVEDSVSETFKNIFVFQMLFRIGVFSWLIILVSSVFAAWGLYISQTG